MFFCITNNFRTAVNFVNIYLIQIFSYNSLHYISQCQNYKLYSNNSLLFSLTAYFLLQFKQKDVYIKIIYIFYDEQKKYFIIKVNNRFMKQRILLVITILLRFHLHLK